MKIYFIPGLGFDCRIFQKLDLRAYDFNFLEWIEPGKDETISGYACRMSEKIDISCDKIVLIGQSFGGIISQEIAQFIPVKKIILISSIRSRDELPPHFKIIERLNLHHFLTQNRITRSHKYWAKNYGYDTVESQELFVDMLSKQTDNYLQWALKALSVWQTPELSRNIDISQIHGKLDKTFPIKWIKKPSHTLQNGGHFLVYNKAEKVTQILAEILPLIETAAKP